MNIQPCDITGHKTGWLSAHLTVEQITDVLGFPPNIADDPDKVTASWGFTVDGIHCGIWDYNDERWSVYDPHNVLPALFATAEQNNVAKESV